MTPKVLIFGSIIFMVGCGTVNTGSGFKSKPHSSDGTANQDPDDLPGEEDPTENEIETPPLIDHGDDLEFEILLPMNPRRDAPSGTKLYDIVTHLRPQHGNTYYDDDEITWAHETSHGIHSDIRNYLAGNFHSNGFYVLKDRYIVFPEPDMRKSQANSFVPSSLQGDRYDLYLRGQSEWDDTPLYLWDEWNSYVNGTDAGVEWVELGNWDHGWRDGVAGAIEFNVYAIAVAMAVSEFDPNYLEENPNFLKFLAFNLKRSMLAFNTGRHFDEFKWDRQEKFYTNFVTNSDAKEMREFLVEKFGREWCERVIGPGDWS